MWRRRWKDLTIRRPEWFLEKLKAEKRTNLLKVAAYAAGLAYNDYMCNIGISGETGSGKSTLAIEIALILDPKFDFQKNIAYTRKEIIEKAYGLPRRSVLIVDEAIGAYKRRAMESMQKDIVELINKVRYKNHVIIWNLPFFTDLDRDVRKHFHLWAHLPTRGLAVVFTKNRNPMAEDPWLPKRWYQRWSKKVAKTVDEVLEILREHPLYEFTMRFPKLPPRLEAKYKILSEEAKSRLERYEKAEEKYLRLLSTTKPAMIKTYLFSVLALAAAIESGRFTEKDIEKYVVYGPYRPSKQYFKLVADLTHQPNWLDARTLVRHVLKKAHEYSQGVTK